MPATTRQLLGDPSLALRLLTKDGELRRGALDAPVSWVHSSDLADPTPFLESGHVLLTTGTQFGEDASEAAFAEYVERIAAVGVAGLGFGTDVVRAGTPPPLLSQCRLRGLPLFEVPYHTPFIAVVRRAADIIARDSYARHTWALRAQSAVSLAASRSDGLTAVLEELARQLGAGVALWDANGALEAASSFAGDDERISREVERMLEAGRRASSIVPSDSGIVSLQTVGAVPRIWGVLGVVAPEPLDHAAQQVVTSVVGLAELALKQHRSLDRARAEVHTAVLRLLERGDLGPASEVLTAAGGALPEAPLRVAISRVAATVAQRLDEQVRVRIDNRDGSVFFAIDEQRLVLVMSEGAQGRLGSLAQTLGLRFGVSDATDWVGLTRGMRQAEVAFDATSVGEGVSHFGALSAHGVIGALATAAAAAEIAHTVLAPLHEYDRGNGSQLVETGYRWLLSNGELEATARALGVHRHTVRARISTIERLVERDLSTFSARADLWAAYVASGFGDRR